MDAVEMIHRSYNYKMDNMVSETGNSEGRKKYLDARLIVHGTSTVGNVFLFPVTFIHEYIK